MTAASQPTDSTQGNPLLAPWSTPFGLPPFGAIRAEHLVPALQAGMDAHAVDIEAIADNPEPPTFENTALALDRAGALLSRVGAVYGNLGSAHTSAEWQSVERTMSPILAEHDARLSLHPGVFARLDALHAQRNDLGLDPIQIRLIERLHLDAVRSGARLTEAQRTRVAELSSELATLHTQFSQNVLADENGWHLVLTDADLDGLPDWLIAACETAAAEKDLPAGSRIITLSRSFVEPFLSSSTRADLREQLWRAWLARGENGGETDNRALIGSILTLRQELAELQGWSSFTEYQLADTMAGTAEAVDGLLHRVWPAARSAALAEYEVLSAVAHRNGGGEVQPWDWRFWAEQVRREQYALDDAELSPYLSLDGMLGAAFECASKLFGITFHERGDVDLYHPDVRCFEVRNLDGTLRGLFLSDNFARPTKRSGAWMSNYRPRTDYLDGDNRVPIVANHNNFAKAPEGQPTLLSIDDVQTLFHEFGHALHGLLTMSPYRRLGGLNVLIDFVELPSQLFEHWAMEPEVLKRHARHVVTGEPIPDSLVERIKAAKNFNQGFATVEFMASAILDQELHRAAANGPVDLEAFEREQLDRLGMPAAIPMRHRLPHFSHLFSSSHYASAYYVYLWAEVLDADAFEAFQESGELFDPVIADRLRTHVYEAGDTVEPGHTYRLFRGRDADPMALLRGRGLVGAGSTGGN
jgi:peptidyl-dipeptidase Dcp